MERREILQEVAAGTLSPEEAVERLEELGSGQAETPTPPEAGTSRVRRIKVLGDFRSAKITGDASVAEAIVEGSHTVRRDGDVLVIVASESGEETGEWVFPRKTGPRITIGFGSKPKPVSIRMNPELALDVRIDAGSASIEGVRGPISSDIDAGILRIKDFASPIDLQVDAGSVTAEGVLDRGESRIKCDAGNVKVVLRKGSSVRVRAHADVGHVVVGANTASGLHIGGDAKEFVFGDGTGTLEITGGIGRIKVEEG